MTKPRIAVLDFGAKAGILEALEKYDCDSILLAPNAEPDQVLEANPDGILLSNGPGDPAATAEYAVPTISGLLKHEIPIFGICLGHQLLGLALGAQTLKMHHGHHGANHPVKDLQTGRISIVSMNHGFALDRDTLPESVIETHISLFDDSNCGIRSRQHKAFSVQFHPEARPGPQDSFGLFQEFRDQILGTQA